MFRCVCPLVSPLPRKTPHELNAGAAHSAKKGWIRPAAVVRRGGDGAAAV